VHADFHGRTLFTAAFVAALIELCGHIWRDLERLVGVWHRPGLIDVPSQLLWPAATLRLELLLMLDSRKSERWCSMLTVEQRETVRSMLLDVLDAIAVRPDELTLAAIECAQDRLFDEVYTQCAASQAHPVGRLGSGTPGVPAGGRARVAVSA
jgi:hypothetical protein